MKKFLDGQMAGLLRAITFEVNVILHLLLQSAKVIAAIIAGALTLYRSFKISCRRCERIPTKQVCRDRRNPDRLD